MSETASLASRSAAALGWSWVGALARAGLQLLAQIALARLLGPQVFGHAAAVLLVLGLACLVAELGLSSALIQRDGLQPADAGTSLAWVLLASVPIAVCMAAMAPWVARWLGDASLTPLLVGAACIVPLQPMANLPAALLQRRFEVKRLQAIQLLAYALAYGVVGVVLAVLGAGAWSLLAAFATHAVVVGVLAAQAAGGVDWRPRLGAPAERASLLGYGGRTTAANLVNWGIESVDRLMVSALHGPAALGLYSVAANLARAPVTLLVSSAQPVAFAAASRLQDERERLVRGYLAMLTLALLAALPLFGLLAWHAAVVVRLLYGEAWAAAAAPFAWLCVGVPFFVMLALTGPMLRGLDAVASEMRAQGVVLLGLVMFLWLAADQPLWTVAALVSAATLLRAVTLALALSRRSGVSMLEVWRCWLGPGVLLVLTLAACELCAATLGRADVVAVLLSALLAAFGAAVVLKGLGPWLLGAPLVQALGNRRTDSRLASWLCRWSRIA